TKEIVTEEVISEKVERELLVERPALKEDKEEEEVKEEAKQVVVEQPLAAKEIEHEVESVPSPKTPEKVESPITEALEMPAEVAIVEEKRDEIAEDETAVEMKDIEEVVTKDVVEEEGVEGEVVRVVEEGEVVEKDEAEDVESLKDALAVGKEIKETEISTASAKEFVCEEVIQAPREVESDEQVGIFETQCMDAIHEADQVASSDLDVASENLPVIEETPSLGGKHLICHGIKDTSQFVREIAESVIHSVSFEKGESSTMDRVVSSLETQFVDVSPDEDSGGIDVSIVASGDEKSFERSMAWVSDDATVEILPNISDSRLAVDELRGERQFPKKPRKRLVIETSVTETEVKELMSEVKEVTRQIKEEVRELKPDLTPTPEGKETSILPLSESREFLELTDLGSIKEEHLLIDTSDKITDTTLSVTALRDEESSVSIECSKLSLENIGRLTSELAKVSVVDKFVSGIEQEDELKYIGKAEDKPFVLSDISKEGPSIPETFEVKSSPSEEFIHRKIETDDVPGSNEVSNETLDVFPHICEDERPMLPSAHVAHLESNQRIHEEISPEEACQLQHERNVVTDFISVSEQSNIPEHDSSGDRTEVTSVEVSEEFSVLSTNKFADKGSFKASLEYRTYTDTETVISQTDVSESDAIMLTELRQGITEQGDVEKLFQEPQSPDVDPSVIDEMKFIADETDSSAVAEAESTDIELSADRELQETEPSLPTDTEASVTLEKEDLVETLFEERLKVAETELSSAAEDLTSVIVEEIPEETASGLEKSDSSFDVLSPDFVSQPHLLSQTESEVSSSQQEQSWETTAENAAEIVAESSSWRLETEPRFDISADDIVMKDDLLEVTVRADEAESIKTNGKLFTTESGATYVEFETDSKRAICVCEDIVSTEHVDLVAPEPSIIDETVKVSEDALHEGVAVHKETVRTKVKKKRSERQTQRDAAARRISREPVAITATKKVDDRMTLARRPTKESEKPPESTSVSSTGTVSRYRGYMASTLSRDLKVEKSVAERSTYFSSSGSTTTSISKDVQGKRKTTEREESSTSVSPSRTPLLKQTSTGAIPKSPKKSIVSRRVESRSASTEKEAEEAVVKKQTTTIKRSKTTTSAVSSRSVMTKEERVVNNKTYTKSTSESTVQQKSTFARESSSSIRQSRLYSSVKKSSTETEPTQDRGRRKKRDELPKLMDAKRTEVSKAYKKPSTDSGFEDSISESAISSKMKHKSLHLESESDSISEIDSGIVSRSSAKSSRIDHSVTDSVPSTSPSSLLPDQTTDTTHTISPPSAAPSPESSPSIKSVLDKSPAIASERRSSRAPSPSPSASPVRAATSASRGTDRYDYSSHTPPSLPSSPSRLARQTTSQVGVTQLLTSEVFTRTVDASGSIEVIYRQPTTSEALRRVAVASGTRSSLHESTPGSIAAGAEGEISLIDTTDSSLSDSVALPSSSSDHDLTTDTRLRPGGSPASPKPTKRSENKNLGPND
ncbi:hypothetical protein C0J52_26273, partial [Blattella germanica]